MRWPFRRRFFQKEKEVKEQVYLHVKATWFPGLNDDDGAMIERFEDKYVPLTSPKLNKTLVDRDIAEQMVQLCNKYCVEAWIEDLAFRQVKKKIVRRAIYIGIVIVIIIAKLSGFK